MSGKSYNSFEAFGKACGIKPQNIKNRNIEKHKKEKSDNMAEPDYLEDTADYVQIAEDCIKKCCKDYKKEPGRCNFYKLTNTKMQSILTMVNDIYKKYIFLKRDEEIKKEDTNFKNDISRLKVRLVYESGREQDINSFVKNSQLLEGLNDIIKKNDKEKFIRFTRYMEALVAYHRYYTKERN